MPPIKPQEGPTPRIRSAYTHRIKELTNQVWALQQQLAEAISENKLLKQVQGRQTVALQRFHDAESHLPKIFQDHSSETRSLQELLRKARVERNSFAQRLRATEDELLRSRDALQHLELLNQDQSLEKRNKVTLKLAQATADLEGRTRRIQDLERNLQLNQASFHRQIASEMRKTNEVRQLSVHLKKQTCQLTQQLKARERELEINNIYSHRFPKGLNRKGLKASKLVQTDAVSLLLIEAPAHPLELDYPTTNPEQEKEAPKDSERKCSTASTDAVSPLPMEAPAYPEGLEQEQEKQASLVIWTPSAIDPTVPEEKEAEKPGEDQWIEDRKESSDVSTEDEMQRGLSIETSCPDVDAYLAVEAGPSTQDLEREQPKPSDSHCFPSSENILNKGLKPPPNRRQYTFKETILNLHIGKPAYSRHVHTERRSPPPAIESQAGVDDLGSSGYKPSFFTWTGLGQVSPQTEEVGFQRKKRSLMKELFGRGQITDPLPVQRSRSRGQSSGLDTDKPRLASEMDEDLE